MTSLGYVKSFPYIPILVHVHTPEHCSLKHPPVLSGYSRPDEMSQDCSAATAAAEASVGCVGCARALQKAEPSSLLELSPQMWRDCPANGGVCNHNL